MRHRFSFVYKVILVIVILTIIYNEYIIYEVNSLKWATLECKNETNCVKVLLVADPQLIGEENEIYHFLTPVSIWDSDRFIQKTYTMVLNQVTPDVVIFLGDLLDEGSIATTAQFNRYLERLFSVFTTQYHTIKHIWLPGDNDIGGETDRITKKKVKRFEDVFVQPPVIDVKHVRFSKVNRMVPQSPKSFEFMDNNHDQLSVVVSHMPLILVPALYVDKVLQVLKPKLIFSAHEHKSKIVQSNLQQDFRKIFDLSSRTNELYNYNLERDQILEILVPTCSYRMGTPHIGYGAALIVS